MPWLLSVPCRASTSCVQIRVSLPSQPLLFSLSLSISAFGSFFPRRPLTPAACVKDHGGSNSTVGKDGTAPHPISDRAQTERQEAGSKGEKRRDERQGKKRKRNSSERGDGDAAALALPGGVPWQYRPERREGKWTQEGAERRKTASVPTVVTTAAPLFP